VPRSARPSESSANLVPPRFGKVCSVVSVREIYVHSFIHSLLELDRYIGSTHNRGQLTAIVGQSGQLEQSATDDSR